MKFLIPQFFLVSIICLYGGQTSFADCPENQDCVTEAHMTIEEVSLDQVVDAINLDVGQDEEWWKLTLYMAGIAPVEFLLSTTLHEGSHALLAEAFGSNVDEFAPYPHVKDGNFYFGRIHRTGDISPEEEAIVLAAPMFLDTLVLSTYAGLVFSDNLPENKYLQATLLVFSVGHWIDLGNHFMNRGDYTDTKRIEDYFVSELGWTPSEATTFIRGTQGLVLLGGGVAITRGLFQLFNPTNNEERTNNKILDLNIIPNVAPDYYGLQTEGHF